MEITKLRKDSTMEFGEESSPALAFEKDAFELTVEDVYDISYVIGRDLLKISSAGEEVSDLQFRIVRVLEMFETLVNKYNLSVEELKLERDNLKSELDRIIKEGGPNQLVVDLTDPNRPRFTMQELKEVLQERNQLKAQLMVAQEELQLYKRWGFFCFFPGFYLLIKNSKDEIHIHTNRTERNKKGRK
uniref:RILP-like protein 2 n=1 Tax=Oryzias latipes TaxID=8090 RepID=H2LNT6_ORYLA